MLMDSLLNNRDDSEEAKAAFDKAFITLDNSMVTDKHKLVGIIQRGWLPYRLSLRMASFGS